MDVAIWNVCTGEKIQVISFPFCRQVSAVLWIPAVGEREQRLAFGFANGSIHIWVCVEHSVSSLTSLSIGVEAVLAVHIHLLQPSIWAQIFCNGP